MTRTIAILLAAIWGWCAANEAGAAEMHLPGLGGPVDVVFDAYDIPHVYAETWSDASRVLGYIHAGERLWQMDMFRRRADGTLAEVLGRSQIEHDKLVRRLGIRRGCVAMWNSEALPAEMRRQLEAYAEGVNARIDEFRKSGFPEPFKAMGYEPAPWKPVDATTFGKYMSWDQAGTEDDLWFGMMVEKLGVEAIDELWPLVRPYEIPAVKSQADRARVARAELRVVPGTTEAWEATRALFAEAGWFSRGLSFGSNNWAVDGTKTKSGLPILASDPHLGFTLPSLWYTAHLSVKGRNVAGVTFPGSPVVIIGHNDVLGWGITNMQSDSVDYFLETMRPGDPLQYRHKGEWRHLTRVTESIPVRGEPPVELHIDSTVHGPIISREGRALALQWTGLGPTTEMIAFWEMNHARNVKEWLAAADKVIAVPLNLCYADADGNILMHPCGAHPVRPAGRGRIPLDGASGADDWTEMLPRSELPLALNPGDHFVASANGRPAPFDYPHYLGWMWDPSYRVRRINDMLAEAKDLTVESMAAIQNDVHDKCAERFLPALLAAVDRHPPDDPTARRALEVLKGWNYRAEVTSPAPILWLRWLDAYRSAVWDDEWAARGIRRISGSWGYSGTNRREPMLEVLEQMTREKPDSIWFDDKSTPERETLDDVAQRSFAAAVARVTRDHGNDPARWQWGTINSLRIRSMTGDGALARSGGPVPGTKFTVNPGGDGGTVGSGASFRMIVDFGGVPGSLGVYPGGQSADPRSPHYDDQMKLWAAGKYVPLNLTSESGWVASAPGARVDRYVPAGSN